MRFLDRNKIPYEYQTYECDEFIDGISVADKNGNPIRNSRQKVMAAYSALAAFFRSSGFSRICIPLLIKSDFLTNRFIKLSSQSEKAVDIMSLSFLLRQNWI